MQKSDMQLSSTTHLVRELSQIGIALSQEKNHNHLMELILKKSMELTSADGGTLYRCTPENKLEFEIVITDSLNIHLGGTSEKAINLPPLHLINEKGEPNVNMVATWAAISKKTANIPDIYKEKKFDFSGTKAMDKEKKYHSQSFLTVPMVNHLDQVIGVLQLINSHDSKNKIHPFQELDQVVIESLASQAAMAITQKTLIEAQKGLFDSLIKLIAVSIDEKSAYTGGHCRRVPVITNMIVDAICETREGAFKDFCFSEDEKYELEVAAWLHDCGKLITPEHVVDKATKLESIFDRVHLIDTRFEILKRDVELAFLRGLLDKGTKSANEHTLQEKLADLDNMRKAIRKLNIGKENIDEEQLKNLEKISQLTWITPDNKEERFLSTNEVHMLKIARGTLSMDERQVIQNHVVSTAKMLHSLPYPEKLKNVPYYASYHHEKIDGSGYPEGLKGDQIPIQARIIAIADIFEALTAGDRPYKKSLSLDDALKILKGMAEKGELDRDVLDVFLKNKIHEIYAERFLNSNENGD